MAFSLCICDYSSDYHCFADALLWTMYHSLFAILFNCAMSAMKDSQHVVLHPVNRDLTYTDMFPFPANYESPHDENIVAQQGKNV